MSCGPTRGTASLWSGRPGPFPMPGCGSIKEPVDSPGSGGSAPSRWNRSTSGRPMASPQRSREVRPRFSRSMNVEAPFGNVEAPVGMVVSAQVRDGGEPSLLGSRVPSVGTRASRTDILHQGGGDRRRDQGSPRPSAQASFRLRSVVRQAPRATRLNRPQNPRSARTTTRRRSPTPNGSDTATPPRVARKPTSCSYNTCSPSSKATAS